MRVGIAGVARNNERYKSSSPYTRTLTLIYIPLTKTAKLLPMGDVLKGATIWSKHEV